MTLHNINGTRLYVHDTGGEGVPVVFSHGLLWSHEMFEDSVDALRDSFRCVAYDHRGQGRSEKPKTRAISIEGLTEDAIDLIEEMDLAPCHFVGLSMGGFVGMRIAARRPELLRSLVLMSTAADEEPRGNLPKYNLLNLITRLFGVRLVTRSVMPIMFGETFLNAPERDADRKRWRQMLQRNERSVTRAVRGVFEREGVVDELSQIQCPTLVLHGAEDAAISIPRADALREHIPNAELIRTPIGGHSLPIETPEFVRTKLRAFFESQS